MIIISTLHILYCAPSGRRIQSVQKYLSECFKINEERPRRVFRHLGYIVGYLQLDDNELSLLVANIILNRLHCIKTDTTQSTLCVLFYRYLEDMASTYDCSQLSWIKTLQGFSQCLQSFVGEMPIFFCSGSIIKKIGHKHCMSLVLFIYTVRFFFYSIMTNPVWVLLIEILNGMMYALGRAVIVSYSRMISPPGTQHTVLGLIGLFDCIGE